jgi:DNA-binding transcriptional LysR family regulator
MMKLDGVAVFVACAEARSISGAARRLGIAKSVASERLAELERVLGTRLLQRTTRKVSVTEDGSVFLERARRILRESENAVAELAERHGTLVGPLRLSAPVTFGVLHLGPALYPFLAANPGIDLTLDLDDRFVDAAADGYDAVVRHGPLLDAHLVVKRLAPSRRVLVAAPQYLAQAGSPASIADLAAHRAINYAHREADWRFRQGTQSLVIRPQRSLRFNNGILMRDAAVAGLGIALLPTFIVYTHVATDALRIVEVGAEAESAEVQLTFPPDRLNSAKVRALAASLRASFGSPPYWDRRGRATARGGARS